MRSDGGYEVIKKAIKKLGMRHKEHIAAYGEGNERRLTGRHETADINTFIWVKLDLQEVHVTRILSDHTAFFSSSITKYIFSLLVFVRALQTVARRCGSAVTPRRKAKVRGGDRH